MNPILSTMQQHGDTADISLQLILDENTVSPCNYVQYQRGATQDGYCRHGPLRLQQAPAGIL